MTQGRYGYLSNFYPCIIEVDGIVYRSVEHLFQAQKYKESDPDRFVKIVNAETARGAKWIARAGALPRGWIDLRDSVMLTALRLKYAIPEFRELLLATDDAILIENSPYDYYWGIGANGRGDNRLGDLLMQVREEIRNEIRREELRDEDRKEA